MFSRAGNGRKPTEKIKIIPKNNPQRAAVAELRFKRIYMISKPLLMMKKEKKKKRKDGRKVGLLYWARRSALVCFGLGSEKFSSGVEEGLDGTGLGGQVGGGRMRQLPPLLGGITCEYDGLD